eukprot:5140875-Prorocentrum_lima.AAC.1
MPQSWPVVHGAAGRETYVVWDQSPVQVLKGEADRGPSLFPKDYKSVVILCADHSLQFVGCANGTDLQKGAWAGTVENFFRAVP